MANPEIKPMLQSIGWTFVGDLDGNGEINLNDYALLEGCLTGPGGGALPPGCSEADLDGNGTVDLGDVAIFQRLFEGP
jgi:hypothetical protein